MSAAVQILVRRQQSHTQLCELKERKNLIIQKHNLTLVSFANSVTAGLKVSSPNTTARAKSCTVSGLYTHTCNPNHVKGTLRNKASI